MIRFFLEKYYVTCKSIYIFAKLINTKMLSIS